MFKLHLCATLVLFRISVFGHINRILYFIALQSIACKSVISTLLVYQNTLWTRCSIHRGCSGSKTRSWRLKESTTRCQAKALRIHITFVTLLSFLLPVLAFYLCHNKSIIIRLLDHFLYHRLRHAFYLIRLCRNKIISSQSNAHLYLCQYCL